MEREKLIKKWLDNELNSQELEAFKTLEDYDDLIKLSNHVKQFKAPKFNPSEEFKKLHSNIKTHPQLSKKWLKPLLRVAAIITICFSAYYYTTTLDTTITTIAGKKTNVMLPDASEVTVNASSNIVFNKSNWNDKRVVSLEGEAYFKVAKGSTFNVNTNAGIVTVLGTQFNVKQRDNIFEVICFEGSVRVSHSSATIVLKPGDSFLIIDKKQVYKEKENIIKPSWVDNTSNFKSLPFKYVINEFERQYNVVIKTNDIDVEQLFTGSFVHNDKKLALKSITLPLNLNYTISDNTTVVFTRE